MTPEENQRILDNLNDERFRKYLVRHLDNVLDFIINFFEDDNEIQPIKKELQSVIDQLTK
jgi:hypothetical protein